MQDLRTAAAIVKVRSVDAAVKSAIELAGGLKGLEPGMVVLIKPNVNSDDPFPATSNPETVAALINYVKRYSPKRVIVGDASNSSFLPTIESMRTLGVYRAAREAGADVVGFEEEEWVEVAHPRAVNWRRFKVPKSLLDVDYVISQCVIKTHFKAVYSMALKNWMGVIDHFNRFNLHASPQNLFYKKIAELNLARPADFVLLDGIKAMVRGGPFSGDVVPADLMVATPNLTAADAVGLAVLKYLGTEKRIHKAGVWEQPVLQHGVEIGLGVRSGADINLIGSDFDDLDVVSDFVEVPRGQRKAA